MTILAFGSSNSSTSINQQLASYAASLLDDCRVISLTDYNIPLYAIDTEQNDGIPAEVKRLHDDIAQADALIISNAEHNGNPTAFFKSHIDWLSRHNRAFLQGKRVVLLATSPGAGGGKSALAVAEKMLPFFGADIVATLTVPKFYDVFKDGYLTDADLDQQLKAAVAKLTE